MIHGVCLNGLLQDAELDWLEQKFGGIGETTSPTPDMSAEAWLRLQVLNYQKFKECQLRYLSSWLLHTQAQMRCPRRQRPGCGRIISIISPLFLAFHSRCAPDFVVTKSRSRRAAPRS